MRAGALDRKLTVQSFTEARDTFGEPIKTWANVTGLANIWCSAVPVRGQERFAADSQEFAQLEYKFRVRYSTAAAGITEAMRIQYPPSGDLYDITSISEIGRREGYEILATAHVP